MNKIVAKCNVESDISSLFPANTLNVSIEFSEVGNVAIKVYVGKRNSDAFLNDLTWQVLIKEYVTLLLLVHQLTFVLR